MEKTWKIFILIILVNHEQIKSFVGRSENTTEPNLFLCCQNNDNNLISSMFIKSRDNI